VNPRGEYSGMKKPEYRVIRSARRTIALEISQDLTLTVRAPKRLPLWEIERFVASKADWIERHRARMRERCVPPETTPEETALLTDAARRFIPERVAFWSQRMGLSPTRVTITRARTRYGSCSPKDALSFSCFLMRREEDLIDYVVVHELAHIRYKNHGREFHQLIEAYLPGHRALEKRLRGR
jgi:predicted metal-dependent hydrolase